MNVDLNLLIDFSESLEKDLKSQTSSSVYLEKTLPSEFKILKTLAKGGYGEVFVVEKDGKIYAMKKVSKSLVLKNSTNTFFKNEKEIMTTHGGDWLVKSYLTIQDESHLYYIMEFVHGGDLMGYLSKKEQFYETEIKFYAAEIFTAVNEMHKQQWIHRDLKPDNILIDRDGHVKLADFGSCAKLVNGKTKSKTAIGTPDYICPESIKCYDMEVEYGTEVDFWAIGAIIYEMVVGYPPFFSNTLKETYDKIEAIDFSYPDDSVSEDLKDLINNLLIEKEKRFTFEQVKAHKFFAGINWDTLRETEPPFKPVVKFEDDISNFTDTGFDPDTYSSKEGFSKFIGFTHDPKTVKKILDGIVKNNQQYFASIAGSVKQESQAQHLQEDCKVLERNVKCKFNELEDLKKQIHKLTCSKDELASQVALLNSNLQQSIDQISDKKDYLASLQSDINLAKEQLRQLKEDISEKAAICNEIDKRKDNTLLQYQQELNDIKKLIERAKFSESLDNVQQTLYWFYKQNESLSNEINLMNLNISENKTMDDLKKQLRMQKNEIREYEQKIENEIIIRQRLEEEIKGLKKSLKEASRSFNNFIISCANANSNKDIELSIENGALKFNDEHHMLNTLYIRDLKHNEFHHLPEKKRNLSLLMYFLDEPLKCSSTSGSRRSVKALEADLNIEVQILNGLDSLLSVVDGASKVDIEKQRLGSIKKINQLKSEIEVAKKSTIVEGFISDDEKVYEFNNHIFYEKTVAKGTLCDHCNEVLYGVINQCYCCKDCHAVVHKNCYVLIDVSCELNKAIRRSRFVPIVCKSLEDKERLLKLNKVM